MSYLQELDVAVSKGSPENRERALWYATDLLIVGRYTDDEIWMFGEIIGRLEREIETAARAQLARRLARSFNSRYESLRSAKTTAAISGVCATCFSKGTSKVDSSRGSAVALASTSNI